MLSTEISAEDYSKELSDIIEFALNEIYIVDFNTLTYLYVNKGACSALGYTKKEMFQINIFDINPELTIDKINFLNNSNNNNKGMLHRTIHKRKDGTTYHAQSYLYTKKYHNKDAYIIFSTDISEQIKLELQHQQQSKILEHIHESVISTDLKGRIISYNKGSENLLGYTEEEILGQNIVKIYYDKNCYSFDSLAKILAEENDYDMEAYLIKKDRTTVLCDISLSSVKDGNGNFSGIVGYSQDITDRKEAQMLLEKQARILSHQANHDTLTNLPNRTLFKDRLTQTVISSSRNKEQFALFFIDLDQFKKINDTLGHHVGDKVLIEAANRLQGALRAEDTLARLGGDEFTIILKDIKNLQSASTVAQKITETIKEPLNIDGHTLFISSSIGISLYPTDSQNEEDLIKYADTAMYKAKDEGRDNFQYYSADMTARAFERVRMERDLRIAIREEQFIVYFQPQVNALNGKITGMEALVRWQFPEIGLVPPGKFIPIAEESGLIIEIDRIVMKQAMHQFALWYKDGLNPGILSLNLAMKQLAEDDFIQTLQASMHFLGFQPEWLELEVTESQVMNNPDASIKKLKQISDIGIELAIDDFGTGYSSLAYLKKFPLDKLKIDQSFVRDIPEDEDDVAITKAIIALAKSLNLKLIAEGVETQEQRDFLVENGCSSIQGYFYYRPMPAEEITKILQDMN
ncbi:MAG: EAL domain-containing protein [Sulfurimonas sp.]|jgi:diguanylate cyclase (GGDEF)-like protein/PAS domain S-box-containing protein